MTARRLLGLALVALGLVLDMTGHDSQAFGALLALLGQFGSLDLSPPRQEPAPAGPDRSI